jgi:glycosyltransferase 2 family protein
MRRALSRSLSLRLAIVAVALAGVALLLVWRGPSLALVRSAFSVVEWQWVGVALLLNVASVGVRVLAWRTVIHQAMPAPHPRLRAIFSAFSVGLLANAVLPGRIGELARVAVLTRRSPGGPGTWATLAGTVFAHRAFELVAVLALIAYVVTQARVPAWALTTLAALVALALTLFAFGLIGARQHRSTIREEIGALRRLIAQARNGLGVMREPIPAAFAIGLQCVAWGIQLAAVYVAMRAFQIHEPLAAAGLVLVLMNVAMLFPLWPGNVGLVQAAVALPLLAYGIDYAHGFAFGIGLQAIEATIGIGLGMIFLTREGVSLGTLRSLEGPAGEPVEGRDEAARARVPG